MSNIDLIKLFKPGTGVVPPYLAGRQREQEYFRECVHILKDREPLSQDLILYGPRGNGKTALLRHLQKETLKKEKLDILWVKPYELETRAGLENLAIGKLRDKVKNVEVSANIGVAGASVGLDYSEPAATLANLLRSRSQARPVILMIDEAHTLKPEVGQVLLNVSQDLRSEGNPFLLVLAGTPNLQATLESANASFWGRSKIFPLGRLSPEEAQQAITVPLEKAGVSLAPGVAEEAAKRAHCYPYFVQIQGDCLARKLSQTGETGITLDMIRGVEAETHRERDLMYQTRFDEIERKELLSVARNVADAFIQTGKPHKPHLHGNILKEAIRKGLSGDDEPVTNKRILENLDQLYQLGYVWRVEGANYEPGIPSLMTYIQEHSLSPTHEKTTRTMEDQTEEWRKDRSRDRDIGIEI